MISTEQRIRNLLERAGIEGAQDMTSGELVELSDMYITMHDLWQIVEEDYGSGVDDGYWGRVAPTLREARKFFTKESGQ